MCKALFLTIAILIFPAGLNAQSDSAALSKLKSYLAHTEAFNEGNFCIFSRAFPVYDKPDSPGKYSTKRMSVSPRHTGLSFSKKKKVRKSDEETFPVSLKFYPEGGGLVSGLSSVVAFEAKIRDTGKPLELQGSILDSKGNEIVAFRTFHKGRGTFCLAPQEGKKIYCQDLLRRRMV